MTGKTGKNTGNKELWGCIGTVTAALITGIVTLIAADKFPFISTPSPNPTSLPAQQEVLWIRNNEERGAGMCIDTWSGTTDDPVCPNEDDFIPWDVLKDELKQEVLPLVPNNVPPGSILEIRTGLNIESNKIIDVINPKGEPIANVWIGKDPLRGYQYDGLIRIGTPDPPVVVWATFIRYSDNSYRKQ